MEKRSGGVMIVRFTFFIIITALLVLGFMFSDVFDTTPFHIQGFVIFFFTTWVFILGFIAFEKLLHI
ncbi:MAG: hypothetical protein JW891_03075 [Candidatus Lokiarchaeota archaeon]|nr:hypothetical protein [Candidatus Lokiarchaeota archaeon]